MLHFAIIAQRCARYFLVRMAVKRRRESAATLRGFLFHYRR